MGPVAQWLELGLIKRSTIDRTVSHKIAELRMTLIPKNVTGNPATYGNASRRSEDDERPVL